MVNAHNYAVDLREDQKRELERIINEFEQGSRRIILEGKTGIGKTRIAIEFLKYLKSKKKDLKTLIVVHRRALAFNPWRQELVKWYEEIIRGDKFMIISGNFNKRERKECYKYIPNKDIVIISIQTLNNDLTRKLIDLDKFDLFIFDECHNVVAEGEEYGKYRYSVYYKKAVNLLLKKDACVLGLTIPETDRTKKTEEMLRAVGIEARAQGPKTETKIFYVDSVNAVELDEIFRKVFSKLRPPLEKILGKKIPWKINEERFNELMEEKGIDEDERDKYLWMFRMYKKLIQARACVWDGTLLHNKTGEEVFKYLSKRSNLDIKYIYDLFINTIEDKINNVVDLITKLVKENKRVMVYCKYKKSVYRVAKEIIEKIPDVYVDTFVGGDSPIRLKDIQEKAQVAIFSPVAKEGLDLPQFDALVFVSGIAGDFVRKQISGRIRGGEVYYVVFKDTNDEEKLSKRYPEPEVVIHEGTDFIKLPISSISRDFEEATYEIYLENKDVPLDSRVEIPITFEYLTFKYPFELIPKAHVGKLGEILAKYHLETHGLLVDYVRRVCRRKKRYLRIYLNKEQTEFIKSFEVIPEPPIDLIVLEDKPIIVEVKTSIGKHDLKLEGEQKEILDKAIKLGFEAILATVKIEFKGDKLVCEIKLWFTNHYTAV